MEIEKTQAVLAEVLRERFNQDEKWGEQNHPDGTKHTATRLNAVNMAKKHCESGKPTWRKILNEEIQEAFYESDEAALRAELVQCSAVAVAWIEAIDRRKKSEPVNGAS